MNSATAKQLPARIRRALGLDALTPAARKWIIGIVGGLFLLVGVALLFLPGPAFVVIPLGLAILASEFEWAQRHMKKARAWYRKARGRKRRS